MGDDFIRKSGAAPGAKLDANSDYTIDPGPYEAEVIAHIENTRMGQIKVYIPDWGGRRDEKSQVTVSYASPFYGTTYGTDSQQEKSGPWTSGHSYGMWMMPPDVGNKVLVMFAGGRRNKGYWFACIYDSSSHHMVPALGRNIGGPANTKVDQTQSGQLGLGGASSDSVLPVIEYNTNETTAFSDLVNTPRYAHPYQSAVLINQGLDRDPIRGAISSSSMREAPSNVYGISTPGRAASSRPAQSGATEVEGSQTVFGRLGGHSFVMDDGDKDGKDRLIRLRTSSGHQVLMNDTENILYIASASGYQWMEFSADGHIHVYGAAGINMRSKGPLNLYSDSLVAIDSAGAVKIHGEMGVDISSLISCSMSGLVSTSVATDGILLLSGVAGATLSAGGAVNVSSIGLTNIFGSMIMLNSGLPVPPKPSLPTPTVFLPDVTWGGKTWTYNPGSISTICSLVPSHEPWIDPSTGKRPAPKYAKGGLLGIALGAVASFGAGAMVPGLDLAVNATNVATNVATSQAIGMGLQQVTKK